MLFFLISLLLQKQWKLPSGPGVTITLSDGAEIRYVFNLEITSTTNSSFETFFYRILLILRMWIKDGFLSNWCICNVIYSTDHADKWKECWSNTHSRPYWFNPETNEVHAAVCLLFLLHNVYVYVSYNYFLLIYWLCIH